MRCFISIHCPLKFDFNELKEIGNLNLVKEENFHLTLKFLGEISAKDVFEVRNILNFLKMQKNYKISLKGIGYFPSENYVRVLWIGVEDGREKIIQIQKEIDENLKHKFKKEKDFVPHLTIARVKNIINKEKLKNFIKKYENFKFLEFYANEICLMRSELKMEGPKYSVIEKYKLM